VEPTTKRTCPLDEKERFVKLYDVIAEGFRSYTQNVVWTAGLLVGSIGWFLQSDSARNFVHVNPTARIGAAVVVVLVAALHTAASWLYYKHSQMRIDLLESEYDDLHPLPYKDFRIRGIVFVINLVLNWALAGGLIVLIITASARA
jgi:hypothetical protein